jgi:hypothetical protein
MSTLEYVLNYADSNVHKYNLGLNPLSRMNFTHAIAQS